MKIESNVQVMPTEQEIKEFNEYMNRPLSLEEKQIVLDAGYVFASDDYVYIPDDYDGCMASGIAQIRYGIVWSDKYSDIRRNTTFDGFKRYNMYKQIKEMEKIQ
jgi:hypothetical protein